MLCDVAVMDFALAVVAFPLLAEISELDLVLVIDFAMDFVAIDWFLAFDPFARAFAADVASDVVPLDLAFAISATPEPYVSSSVFPYVS